METITRKILTEEFTAWDKLVMSSPQASIFHTSAWNQMLYETTPEKREWVQLVCERDGVFLGGIVLHIPYIKSKRQTSIPILGYNGPILSADINYQEPYKTVPGYEVILELLKNIKSLTNHIIIQNQPEIWDIRAYAYNGWKINTNYTHILPCSSSDTIWEKIDTALKEKILTDQYSIKTDFRDSQIQKFSLYASQNSAPAHIPQALKAEILKKRIYWMKEKGLCQLITLSDHNGNELAITLFILSKENQTIYMWKTIPLTRALESDILPSLIWQSCLFFESTFQRMDLGMSTNMAISNIKDQIGSNLIPIHTAKCQIDFLHNLHKG